MIKGIKSALALVLSRGTFFWGGVKTLVKQHSFLPLLAKHIPVELFGLNMSYESNSAIGENSILISTH